MSIELKLEVELPIIKAWKSENYALMVTDSAGITHYWDSDGTYDGWSAPGCIDIETKQNLN